MLFIFSTPVLIRHLWQLKTVVFLHWCLICTVPFVINDHCKRFIVKAPRYLDSSSVQLDPHDQLLFPELARQLGNITATIKGLVLGQIFSQLDLEICEKAISFQFYQNIIDSKETV